MMPCCRLPPTILDASCIAVVLRPSGAQDIAKLVQFANRQGIKITMLGQGHSFFGQTQVADGVGHRLRGPAWQTVQAAKTKFDPKNVLTPVHGMFPG
jgi:FAD/FMN-containing dehydrogenase